VEFVLSTDDEAFREELLEWLGEHLVGEFREVAGRGGPDDDDCWDVRRAWDRELASGGWIGLGWPKEYGGREASYSQEIIFQLEHARAGAPARGGFHGETLLAPTLVVHGTEEQKERMLIPMSKAEVVWCQGYSEPDAGSDLANIRTRARLEGDEWVINGQKIWTTFAHRAGWMFLICRTEAGSARHAGLSYMVCPVDQPGVEVRPIRTMTGDSAFSEVFFNDARTAADNVVGAVGDGWRVAMSTLGHERATSVLGYQFSFQRELDALLSIARTRGRSSDVGIRRRLADALIGFEVLRCNTLRVIGTAIQGRDFGPEASIGKLYWSQWHQRFTELAMDVLGADAVHYENSHEEDLLQRAFLRARAETIYTGTTEIQKNIISERVLGMPRELKAAPR
jgi:alkylation response protein AidB-like acyl-CoA dehydrogenase